MENFKEVLAWKADGTSQGIIYSSESLKDKRTVINLFSSCKESMGYINAEGWEFLFSHFSFDELLELDKETGWFDSNEDNNTKKNLVYQSLISGYDPTGREKGDYDPDTAIFLPQNGHVRKIDWNF